MSHFTERRQLLALAATAVGATVVAGCAKPPAGPNADAPTATAGGRTATTRPTPTVAPTTSPADLATPAPEATLESTTVGAVPLSVLVYNRLAYGPRPGDLERFASLPGADGREQLAAWLDEQLTPDAIDDSETEDLLAANELTTLRKTPAQIWTEHVNYDASDEEAWRMYSLPGVETRLATYVRAVHSRRQLYEVLVEFWHNHFNVYGPHDQALPYFGLYDRDAIRAHATGNFGDMLRAVARHPAMLYYLDQYTSMAPRPNENYARELLELHTLGAMNYLGVKDPTTVDGFQEGNVVGYVDNDVYEAARAFSGWRVGDDKDGWEQGNVPATGEFFYYAEWHDRFNKIFLGRILPADQADEADGEQVLNALARHPGTARHIATKLARRLISDDPPEDAVQAGAEAFLAHIDAPDQIAQVVRAIVLTDAFQDSWGSKIKRPLETAFSAIRALDARLDRPTDDLTWALGRMGQPMFEHHAPNGYPDVRDAWSSTVSVLTRWQFTALLAHGWISEWNEQDPDHSRPLFAFDLLGASPASRTARDLAEYWPTRLLGRPLSDAGATDDLARFLAGDSFGVDDPITDDEYLLWRLPGMINLVFMSPDFLLR